MNEQWSGFAIGATTGAFLAWIATMLRTAQEIKTLRSERDKLQAEVTALTVESVLHVQKSRKDFDEANVAMGVHLAALFNAVKSESGEGDVDGHREAACGEFFRGVIPRFVDYAEIHAEVKYQSSDERKEFIDEDLLDDLKRFAEWLKILNSQKLLDRCGRTNKATLSKKTLKPIRDLVKKIEYNDRRVYYEKVDAAIDAILANGHVDAD